MPEKLITGLIGKYCQWILPLLLCNTVNAQQVDINAEVLRIDPTSARGAAFAEIGEEVKFIPLESGKESVFGKIDQLEITNKYFIILDRETNTVLLFDKNGKFHSKIKDKRTGNLYVFYYNPINHLIQIPYHNTFLWYNEEGKYVKKSKVPYNETILFNMKNGITVLNSYHADSKQKDSICYELTVLRSDEIIHAYLPYNLRSAALRTDDIMYVSHFNFYPDPASDSLAYFVRPYDYSIYTISPNTFSLAYRFVFPMKYSLPVNFTSDTVYSGKRIPFITEEKDKIYYISNIYKKAGNLFFKLNTQNFNYTHSYVYNVKSNNLFLLDKISPDSLSYLLPITDAGISTDFLNKGILNSDEKYLYTAFSSLVLFQQKDATKNKVKYPTSLSEYLSNERNRRGNPVIVQIRFKENI